MTFTLGSGRLGAALTLPAVAMLIALVFGSSTAKAQDAEFYTEDYTQCRGIGWFWNDEDFFCRAPSAERLPIGSYRTDDPALCQSFGWFWEDKGRFCKEPLATWQMPYAPFLAYDPTYCKSIGWVWSEQADNYCRPPG